MRIEIWVLFQILFFAWIVWSDWRYQRIPALGLLGLILANVEMFGFSTLSIMLMAGLLMVMDVICGARLFPWLPVADKVLLFVLANMVPVTLVPFVLIFAGFCGVILGVCLKKTSRLTTYPFSPVVFLGWIGLLCTCHGHKNALELKSGLMFF